MEMVNIFRFSMLIKNTPEITLFEKNIFEVYR